MKSQFQEQLNWVKNIITWALLGIAGYQFTDLIEKVETMYEEVITHKEKLKRNDKDIDEIKMNIQQLYQNNQTKISQNNRQWHK